MTSHRAPRHTDQCIRDAAVHGFCEHTLLPSGLRSPARAHPTPLSALPRVLRALLPWLAFLLLVGLFVALFQQIGWWALLYQAGFGLSWLVIFILGLPPSLTADLTRVLPADARERLEAPHPHPHPKTTKGPSRHRRSGPSHPS
jgi:hypothetical protein